MFCAVASEEVQMHCRHETNQVSANQWVTSFTRSQWVQSRQGGWLIQYTDNVVTSQIGNGFGTVKQVQRPAGKWKRTSPWSWWADANTRSAPGRWLRWLWIQWTVSQQVTRRPKSSKQLGLCTSALSFNAWETWFFQMEPLWRHTGSFSPRPICDTCDAVPASGGTWHKECLTCSPFPGHATCMGALHALTPASVLSLWSFAKFLNWPCLAVLWSVQLLPPHFSLPVNIPSVFSQLQSCRVTVTV